MILPGSHESSQLTGLVCEFSNLSDESIETTSVSVTGENSPPGSENSEPAGSMREFYQLSQELLIVTLALTGIIFICVWIFYSLNIALNYLIGACTGVVYLRMLAKDVERLGREKSQLSKTRLALLIALILLASQWNQLKILPIFLGFLTYKAALIIYVIRTAFISDSQKVGQS
ncbi:ATP synthase subunit I [Chroococcidiopsis sp. CCMEE 29]|uniref:ATP synthase subunit I n=1 Tax=Chroococcidiopsis sp. CCMEE 29 TaxID=155894 RepID=UPI0031F92370